MPTSVMRLPEGTGPETLGPLVAESVEIASDDDGRLWLRASELTEEILVTWQRLSGERFDCIDERRLARAGKRIATQTLPPNLAWQPLAEQLSVELPTALMGGRLVAAQRVRLELKRGGHAGPPEAAIFDLSQLCAWAERTSDQRLRRLSYQVAGERALVKGTPLPPISAEKWFVQYGRVLIPAGFVVTPSVSAQEVEAIFDLRDDQWLVWEANDRFQHLDADGFVAMRRSSLRTARSHQQDAPQ